jgi:raffinose/stachyose/melibiose transport system permease protein
MISMIIGSYMWSFIFTQVVYQLADNWGMTFLDHSWIGDPGYSFTAILIVALWGGAGYVMVIYIAALQSVPRMLYEAATMDGAGPMRRFFSVTLPMIRQSFTICLFITLNNAFQVFDVVYALTGGGPGRSTQVVALNIYEEAFARSNRFGYATAKSTVLFAVLLIVTAVQVFVMKRREEEA